MNNRKSKFKKLSFKSDLSPLSVTSDGDTDSESFVKKNATLSYKSDATEDTLQICDNKRKFRAKKTAVKNIDNELISFEYKLFNQFENLEEHLWNYDDIMNDYLKNNSEKINESLIQIIKFENNFDLILNSLHRIAYRNRSGFEQRRT